MDIKERILQSARTLFETQGYDKVSMRNIADDCGISVGNLTYHYPKKEDLVTAVVLEQHKNYQKFEAPQNLEELHQFFLDRKLHHQRNWFYFHHYKQFAQISPTVYQIQETVMADTYDAYAGAFEAFRQQGIMEPEGFPGQTDGIVQVLISAGTYGLPYMDELTHEGRHQKLLLCLWCAVYPLLTTQGQQSFKQTILPKLTITEEHFIK